MKMLRVALLGALILLSTTIQISAQYFGRNKPQYEKFDFKVLQSPHFEIYHYLDNPTLAKDLAQQCEHWHGLHQSVLADTFSNKNPLLFYNDHADFQQTNAITSSIGIGTGGVTEALKNRVILPLAMSNQQTNHVLGHELVHAFQYNMILRGDSTNLRSLSNLPLWMVEGLAEYMSIGRVDAHTSLWMRDAVLNDRVPSLKQLHNPEYFPYRWGQAFWAFVTGLKGDQIIEPLFVGTAKYGLEIAIKRTLHMSMDDLSKLWQGTIKKHYGDLMTSDKENFIGQKLITDENGGKMNLAPVLSPNGRYVIFLSEKNLFSIDLFLADARTGEVLQKVASTTKDGHLDDFNYIESAGTWSPDSRQFAFVAVKKGRNVLVIKEAQTGKTVEEFPISGVPAFSNPAWSPDGKSIVVSGLVKGQVDLYQVLLKKKKVEQLTNDRYAEMLPNWSADGSQIVFSTDHLSMDRGKVHGKWTFNLAILEVSTGAITNLDFFFGADNLNPIFDNEDNIVFLSNRDGFRNLYKYGTDTKKVFQLTDFQTGVSGITQYAPAISTSTKAKRNRTLFTHYYNGTYQIYRAKSEDFLNREVNSTEVDLTAATLPKVNRLAPDMVDANFENINESTVELSDSALTEVAYRPKFSLDYIGGSGGVGLGVSRGFGTQTGLAGGIDLMFGDITGDNRLVSSIALNGEIQDFGGAVSYLNQKGLIDWGVSLSHTPLRRDLYDVGLGRLTLDNGETVQTIQEQLMTIRTFQEQVGVFAQYPLSKTLRVEGSAAIASYSNRITLTELHSDLNTGILLERTKERFKPEELGLNLFNGQLGQISLALVGDNSYFGIASPLQGQRYRLEVERSFGSFNFYDITADYRKYLRVNPVSFAFRAMHVGRYGKDANSAALFSNFLGYPWYIRGYEFGQAGTEQLAERLLGSKLLVSNFEIRLPFTGPERLSTIKSKFLFTELALFADAGLAWNQLDQFKKTNENGSTQYDFNPLVSVGASVRVNLFGALIVEPYYAFPLSNGFQKGGVFGVNFVPGW